MENLLAFLDPTSFLHNLHLSAIDFFIGVLSFIMGSGSTLVKLKRNPAKGISVFLQVSLIIIKMAKHYYDTHPEAKQKLNGEARGLLEKLYRKEVTPTEIAYKTSEETGAAG